MNTIISVEQVSEKTTLSRSSIYAYAREGKFPAAVKIGARQIGWVEAEVDAWLQKRIDSRPVFQPQEVAA